jgi:DnaJ-class molecular chaperone
MDPYAILGVDPDATERQIREAFRAVVRDRHPDTAPPASEPAAVAEVIEAYRMLMDPGARARHDAARQRRSSGPAPTPPSPRRCPTCDGGGVVAQIEICHACAGSGETTFLGAQQARQLICRTCSGRGHRTKSVTCPECLGSGRV